MCLQCKPPSTAPMEATSVTISPQSPPYASTRFRWCIAPSAILWEFFLVYSRLHLIYHQVPASRDRESRRSRDREEAPNVSGASGSPNSLTSEDENEDISQATELSILDSSRKGKNVADIGSSYTDEGKDLARALEESLRTLRQSRTTKWTSWCARYLHCLDFRTPISRKWRISQPQSVCDVCEELTRSLRYINLNDGRKLCPDCYSVAVMGTMECKPLFDKVHDFFEELNMKVAKKIPFFLIDQDEMDKVSGGGSVEHEIRTIGLTTFRLDAVNSVARSVLKGDNIEVMKETEIVSQSNPVKAILALYGYSKLFTGQTLAHEMMHAWMRLHGYRGLEQKLAEGVCEVMGHKWLDWYDFTANESFSGTPEQAQFLTNLKDRLKYWTEVNYNETYGEGFREAKWAIERHGLDHTLNFIAKNRKLPQ